MKPAPPKSAKGVRNGHVNGSLSVRQRAFVDEYLIDLNATQAAIRAGYSKKTATAASARLLVNVNVRPAIDRALAKRAERVEVEQDRILRQVAAKAFSNMGDYAEWNGSGVVLKDSARMSREALSCVGEVSESRTQLKGVTYSTVKFKLNDQLKALDMLMRHTGMYAAADGAAQAIGAITVEMYRKMMDEASGNPAVNVTPAASIVDGRNGNNGSGD